MARLDRFPFPGVPPDIDLDGAMIGTNATLHTAGRIRYHLARSQGLAAGGILAKKLVEVHRLAQLGSVIIFFVFLLPVFLLVALVFFLLVILRLFLVVGTVFLLHAGIVLSVYTLLIG